MDHVAVMKKAWGLTPKILSGQKKVESRWYKTKHPPWNKIRVGETVYFKDSGEPVTLKATVEKVLQFEDLTPTKVRELLDQYGQDDGIEKADREKFWQILKDKKYCLLIYLTNPTTVKPFAIDKRGFGAMAAWITTPDINHIKK